eukprot:Hpha_TRINITY_DN14278_c0_g2::TRINITY_DN14278_c0_g2_i2::g.22703::m.22703
MKKKAIAGAPVKQAPKHPHRPSESPPPQHHRHSVATIAADGTVHRGSTFVKKEMPAPLRAALVHVPSAHLLDTQKKQMIAEDLLHERRDAEAVMLMEEVLEAKIERGDSSWGYAEELVATYNRAAVWRMNASDPEEAAMVPKLLRRAETLLQTSSAFVGFHPLRLVLLCGTYNNYAKYLHKKGDMAGATAMLKQANQSARMPSTITLLNEAVLCHSQNRGDEAVRKVGQAAAVARHHISAAERFTLSPAAGVAARQQLAAHLQEQRRQLCLAEFTRAQLQLCAGRPDAARGVLAEVLSTARAHLSEMHPLTAQVREALEQVPLYNGSQHTQLALMPEGFDATAPPSELLPFILRSPAPASLCESPARSERRSRRQSVRGDFSPAATDGGAVASPVASVHMDTPNKPVQLPDIFARSSHGSPPPPARSRKGVRQKQGINRTPSPLDDFEPPETLVHSVDKDAPQRFLRLRDFEQRSAALERKFIEQQTPRSDLALEMRRVRSQGPAIQKHRASLRSHLPSPSTSMSHVQQRLEPSFTPDSRQQHPLAMYAGPRASVSQAASEVRRRSSIGRPAPYTPMQPQAPGQTRGATRPRRSTAGRDHGDEQTRLQQEWEARFTSQSQVLPGAAGSEPFTPGKQLRQEGARQESGQSRRQSMVHFSDIAEWEEWRSQQRAGRSSLSRRRSSPRLMQERPPSDHSPEDLAPLTDEEWAQYEMIKAQSVRFIGSLTDPATERMMAARLEEVRQLSKDNGMPVAGDAQVAVVMSPKAEPWTNPDARQMLFHAIRVQMTICRFGRLILVLVNKLRAERERKRMWAIGSIQRVWRNYLLRRDAIKTLKQRREMRLLKEKHFAAGEIQRVWRGRRSRVRTHRIRVERERITKGLEAWERRCEIAAAVVQACWRGCTTRANILRRDDAAASVQAVYRVWRVYSAVRRVVECRRLWRRRYDTAQVAVRKIQSCWRGVGGRRQAAKEVFLRQAAVRVFVLAEAARGVEEWEGHKKERAAANADTIARCLLARHSAAVVARAAGVAALRYASSACVQRLWRCHAARGRYAAAQSDHIANEKVKRRCEEVYEAAMTITALGRGRMARKHARHLRWLERLRLAAVQKIQRVYRGHLGRMRWLSFKGARLRKRERYLLRSEREYAAKTIQRTVRGHLACLEVEVVRQAYGRRHEMARCIQRLARRFLAKLVAAEKRWERYLHRDGLAAADWRSCAATRIQSCYKSRLCRMRLEQRRLLRKDTRHQSAARIQRMFRCTAAREVAASRRQLRVHRGVGVLSREGVQYCATLIQARWRGYWDRVLSTRLRRAERDRQRVGFAWQAYSLRLDRAIERRRAGEPRRVVPKPKVPPATRAMRGPSSAARSRTVRVRCGKTRRQGTRTTILGAFARAARVSNTGAETLLLCLRDNAAHRIGVAWRRSRRKDIRRGLLRTVWLKSLWRRHYRRIVDAQRRAAVLIQSCWRGAMIRLGPRMQRLRAERRRVIAREWALSQASRPDSPADVANEVWVALSSDGSKQRYNDAMRYAHWAALIVQTWWRTCFARMCVVRQIDTLGGNLQVYDQEEEREFAATRVQKIARGHFARRRVKKIHGAANRVKYAFRSAACRRQTRALRRQREIEAAGLLLNEMQNSATIIQRQWRARRQATRKP